MNLPLRRSSSLAFFALLSVSGCGAAPAPAPAPEAVLGPDELPQIQLETGSHVDWQQVGPVAFLDSLVVAGERFVELPVDAQGRFVPAYTIWEEPSVDWFDPDSVAELERRLGSTRPAWHVVASRCSFLPFGEISTEGEQARYLLDGARVGRYPPGLGSHMDPR